MTHPILRYKLTTQNNTTYDNFVWPPMQWKTASGIPNIPCTNAVFHYYDSPHIGMLLNPIHANIIDPKLWQFETKQELGHDGLKGWCKKARVTHAIPLPNINLEQRIEFAIRCAMIAYKNSTWNNWAKHWLENTDRSVAAAITATAASHNPYHIVANVTSAAKAAAHRTAYASYAAYAASAASAAGVAYTAASAAAYAASTVSASAAANTVYATAGAAADAANAAAAAYASGAGAAANVAAYAASATDADADAADAAADTANAVGIGGIGVITFRLQITDIIKKIFF